MKIPVIDWFRNSLFIKMIVLIFLTFFFMMSISFQIHREIFKQSRFEKQRENSVNFAEYIIDDIGFPPDTANAGQLAREMNIQIMIITPEYHWASPKKMKPVDKSKLTAFKNNNSVYSGFDKGMWVFTEKEDIQYQIYTESWRQSFPYLLDLIKAIELVLLAIQMTIIYFLLRWILKPFTHLQKGVQQISSGNLDYELKSKRRDELGILIRTFDDMRREIKRMLHAREQLLLDVSHEMRSPLTRMNVSVEMMNDSEEKEDIAGDLHEMDTMITELLEGARLQSTHGSLNKQLIDLSKLVREICFTFTDSKPGLFVNVTDEPLWVNADSDRIRILLKNIIINGLKYSDEKGKPVEVSVEKTAEIAKITIRDFGIGIPEKELPYIFEPFYRVDKSRSKETGGYGLGMNLSKKIVDIHGGTIDIKSKEKAGTTVTIRLPL